ncbi:MAG: hypothetical protein MK212_08760 [Saprospiraceae bacterium]|nr:hypothetical protein [Saprospiraceae bacterium]
MSSHIAFNHQDMDEMDVAVSADKMNVLYVGMDNPINVAVTGRNKDEFTLSVEGEGASLQEQDGGYVVRALVPGKVTIVVRDKLSERSMDFSYRVKRIPDPVAQLSNGDMEGIIKLGELKVQSGVIAVVENCEADMGCKVQSYDLTLSFQSKDPVLLSHKGGSFSAKARGYMKTLKPGDQVMITNVKARCMGDKVGRRLNGMTFQVK